MLALSLVRAFKINSPAFGQVGPSGPSTVIPRYSATDHNAVDRCWCPGFSLKCGYFLTDTHEAGMANTWIVPGRHMDAALETPEGNVGQPKDACGALLQANIACPLLLILS